MLSPELIRDAFRSIIALAVIAATWDLGRQAVLDASTVAAILGTAVGVVGTAGAQAIMARVNGRSTSTDRES